jgi:hypothetical protein
MSGIGFNNLRLPLAAAAAAVADGKLAIMRQAQQASRPIRDLAAMENVLCTFVVDGGDGNRELKAIVQTDVLFERSGERKQTSAALYTGI